MGRILCLDVGDKRIGIAMSDEMRLIATPHSVYSRVGYTPDCKHILNLYRQNKCDLVVSGLPKNMDGSIGFQAEKVMAFCEKLKEAGMPVYYFPKVIVQHVIPENRTTEDYIRRVGDGIGQSERIRTSHSKKAYLKRGFLEAVKWAGSLVLWCWYQLKGQSIKAKMIIVFRYHITKAFLGK